MIILRVFALTLACHLAKPTTNWMKKTQMNVKLNNIIAKYKNIPITSCQLKCNHDKRCKSIGFEEETSLDALVDCNLIGEDNFCNSKTASIKLYVVGKIGKTPSSCPTQLSCQALYMSNPNLKSGMYRINPSNPINVYCDMGHASRGWMMIANVTVNKRLTETEASQLTSKEKISTTITELDQVGSGTFRFDPKYLSDLDADFQFLYFFCSKPNGKRIDITTTKKEVLDYFMLKIINPPEACGSYNRADGDNSYLTNNCEDWYGGRWGFMSRTDTRDNHFYAETFFIYGEVHYHLSKNRMECDDFLDQNNLFGVWNIWVS